MEKYTKSQLVDYIYHNFNKNGKKIPKKELNALTIEKLRAIVIVNKCQDKLEAWVNRPKLIKFMVDGIQDGKDYSWDCEYPSEEECKKAFEDEGITVIKIVKAAGHHRCKYCGGIAKGNYKDILCDDCRDTFGHSLYSEL